MKIRNNKTKTITQRKNIKKYDYVDGLSGTLIIVCGVLAGAFGSDQSHFPMVLFVFLSISIALFDFFRHMPLKRRWHYFTLLTVIVFLFCGFWEIQYSKPSFFFTSKKPKTLLDLFKNDFSALIKFGEDLAVTNTKIGQITIKSQVYLDFPSQAIFIGFYIPNTPHTYAVCVSLSDHYNKALDLKKRIMAEASATGLQPVNTSELKFSGRVFIYHETPLFEQERRELFALYQSKGLAPQFRDYHYVADVNKN